MAMLKKLLLAMAVLAWPALASANAERPPNIIIIMFDDLSPRINAMGDEVAHTPNLDRLAAQSITFTRTYTTAPVCAPSRAALMAGRQQQTIGAQHMRTRGAAGLPGGAPIPYDAVPPAEVKWFPEILRSAGYFTVNVGKTDYQIGEPFSIWNAHGPDSKISTWPKTRPVFAFINRFLTHESFLWPEDMDSENPLVRAVVTRNRQMLAGKVRRTDPDKVVVPPYLPDTPAVRSDLARLYDNVAYDDEGLGVLLAELEREGWLDNSILIVTGDHGDGLPRMKRSVHASGLHVPMMVRMPDGTGAGTRRDELVSFVDLAPTVLALAGLPVPEWMQGRVFVGAKASLPPRYVLAGADRFDEMPQWQRSVIGARYQYIRNYRPELAEFRPLAFRDVLPTMQELWRGHNAGSLPAEIAQWFAAPRPAEELYDLTTDPHTVRNLADDPALSSELIAMRDYLAAFTERHGDMSAEDERDMIARMWPGMIQPVTATPVATRRAGMIELASATPGASIGWRFVGEDHWRLYREAMTEPGAPIEMKALRYGYAESPAVRVAPAGN